MSALAEVLTQVEDDHSVDVSGPPGAGKSALAAGVVAAMAAQGRPAVVVSPPAGAADAGSQALLGVARHVGVEYPADLGWAMLRKRTEQALREQPETVLALDEPSRWGLAGGVFEERASEAINVFRSGEHVTVTCDRRATLSAIRLPSPDEGELLQANRWGALAEAAIDLARSPVARDIATPLAQRLAVATLAWGGEPVAGTPPAAAGRALADVLAQRRHGRPLWGIWQRLALARTALGQPALEALGFDELSPLATATLRLVLLDGADRLHDTLRSIPEDRPVDPILAKEQRDRAHESLFDYHQREFVDLADLDADASAVHAAEALFHAGELGDETRRDLVRVDSVEQLNALGYRLGVVYQDHAGAARIYRRVLERDPDDAHALHHRAWHLDNEGERSDEVADGYSRALELEPDRAEWHGRRVSFLADIARVDEARVAWAEAESGFVDDRDPDDVYEQLHLPVAASLLATGELTFCAYVLDGVPTWAHGVSGYAALMRLLEGRLSAQANGAVVPAPRSGREWWREGPVRLPARDTERRQLVRWLAGRVDAVTDEEVVILVAYVEAEGPRGYGLARIAHSAWEERLLDVGPEHYVRAGRFVELGRYAGDDQPARTVAMLVPEEPVVPPLRPLPASRWLKTAVDDGSP